MLELEVDEMVYDRFRSFGWNRPHRSANQVSGSLTPVLLNLGESLSERGWRSQHHAMFSKELENPCESTEGFQGFSR